MMRAIAAIAIAVPAIVPINEATGSGEEPIREISREERRMMRISDRDRRRAVRQFDQLTLKGIAWGQELKGSRPTVIELERPLPAIKDRARVDVELFYSYVDNGGGQRIGWRHIGTTAGGWWGSVYKAQVPARLYVHAVGSGPYLDPRWDESRRYYQQLVMAWGRPVYGGARGSIHDRTKDNLRELWRRGDGKHLIATREDAERFMWANWLPLDEWKEQIKKPEIRKQMRESDERWAALATQASEIYPKAFKGAFSPVLLINGKFLITANTGRRHRGNAIENVYRTANRVLRTELEEFERDRRERRRNEVARLTGEEFAYGRENEEGLGQVMELKGAELPRGSSEVAVEWLYSNEAELGRGLAPMLRAWAQGLPKGVSFIEREARDPGTEERAREVNPNYRAEQLVKEEFFWKDPVLLIQGRYLVVGSRFETMAQAMRAANLVVRRVVEGKSPVGGDHANIGRQSSPGSYTDGTERSGRRSASD